MKVLYVVIAALVASAGLSGCDAEAGEQRVGQYLGRIEGSQNMVSKFQDGRNTCYVVGYDHIAVACLQQ